MIFDQLWTSSGVVPEFLDQVPEEPLYMTVEGKMIYPGTPVKTSQLADFPQLWWRTEPGALYTVLLEDNEPEVPRPIKIAHFMAVNVPGTNILGGNIVFDYWPHTTFDGIGPLGTGDKFDPDAQVPKRHMALIYKQKGFVSIPAEEGQTGCGPEPSFFNRANFPHTSIKEKYDLEGPVAGTFYIIKYEEGWAQYNFCIAGSCQGEPIRGAVPGLNDIFPGNPEACKKPEKPQKYQSRWWSSARWSK